MTGSPPSPDFSSLATAYSHFRTSYGNDLFDTIAEHVRRHERSPLRALDVGCGTGLSTRGLLDRGFTVTGVDVAPRMLDEARKTLGDRAAFYEGGAEQLPFGDSAFSLVICAQAFHWFAPEPALAEFARVLEHGGVMAIFWKSELVDDPYDACAADLLNEMSGTGEPYQLSRTEIDDFDSFWAAKRAFSEHEEWRLPLTLHFTVESFVGFHSSRESARFRLGARGDEFLATLRERVSALAGPPGAFDVRCMQYVYLARRR